ncbi:hypothetical protein M5689_004760 [Euphorbia peplus]|nr:hypothetical protein M5689_004760 [Euphorbia peplus]
MESSEPLSIESFSNSWLTTSKFPLDELVHFHETTSSEQLDHYRTPKKRHSGDFNFDVPVSQFHDHPHADQLFSDGIIKPSVHINYKSKMEPSDDDDSIVLASDYSVSSTLSFRVLVPGSAVDVQCQMWRRWRKSVGVMVQKCCGYLRPLCYKIIGSSKSRRRQISSSRSSPQSSPINHFEHSIYEAILHCKR